MNTFNYLHKIAVATAAAAPAAKGLTAAVIGSEAYKALKKGLSTAAGAGSGIIQHAPAWGSLALIIGGLGTGYGLARLTDPRAVSKNSDKLLESEALATEIAVTEKKLKALEARRRVKKARAIAEQAYDRFV